MRKLIAAMQRSLDAKIEVANCDTDCVSEGDWGESYGLAAEVNACVLGRRMYMSYHV